MNNSKYTSSSPLPNSRRHIVTQETDGRLDQVLAELHGISSREMARRLILQGAVCLNGRPGEPSSRPKAGDEIVYTLPPPERTAIPAQAAELDILHEDAAVIVINKAPGVPMHPGPGHRRGTLVNFLLAHCVDLAGIGGTLRPGIVHRLDKDTSGLVVVAKTDSAHHQLAAQFKAHEIHRIYRAIVVGRPPRDQGTIDLPLARHKANRIKRSVMGEGKRAVTHWGVEARLDGFTLLRLRLETGRTHQIRVHLAHEGWPVLGDPLYGGARHRGLNLDPALMKRLDGLRRQALHAAELGFRHPITGEAMHFTAAFPSDLQAVLDTLSPTVAA